jgi:CDP-paratose 2-epimerase
MNQIVTSSPSVVGTKPILITGGAGFIGSNLADRLARSGKNVIVLDSLARPGVEQNLAALKRSRLRNISIKIVDVRDEAAAAAVREASAVVHFAAQVAVTTSIRRPLDDFDINTRGTLNLLEAARSCRDPPAFLFASTNKVYGNLDDLELEQGAFCYRPLDSYVREFGISETRPLSFHTPYGCSKGAADQYVLDYARTLCIPAASFRMSCIYGPRQLGTEDQGWVAHFLNSALQGRPITIYGDGRQVRDVLFVDDATKVYARAIENPAAVAGHAFNVGGGPANAVSLLQVLKSIERMLGYPLEVHYAGWRAGDQRYYVSDVRAVRSRLGLTDATPWETGLSLLADWLRDSRRLPRPRHDVVHGEAS